MSTEITISKIDRELISTFARLDSWFDRVEQSRNPVPVNFLEVLEYIRLSNRYFLRLIDNEQWSAFNAVRENFNNQFSFYPHSNLFKGKDIQLHAFDLKHFPEEIRECSRASKEMRQELRAQLYRYLCHLDTFHLSHEGSAGMAVQKSNLYQALDFIAVHVRTHTSQLEKDLDLLH